MSRDGKRKSENGSGLDSTNLPALPEGWFWTTLADCCTRITDGTHLPPPFVESGIPFIFVQHIVGGSIRFANTKFISESTFASLNDRCPVEVGDILYTAVGSYGVAVPVKIPDRFSFQRHIAHIKPSRDLNQAYLTHCLNAPECLSQAHKAARGVAQKTVTLGDLRHFVLPVAPTHEQQRIAAKIEELFSDLDAGVAALNRVKANLKRYRAAVLKAAVEGKLTEEWRAKNPSKETAAQLLQRILKERRKKWEENQCAAYAKAGKKPPANWRKKYKEPAGVEDTNLPALPEGWCWATADQCTTTITDGEHITPQRSESGIYLLSARNVLDGRLSLDNVDYVTESVYGELSKRLEIKTGDVLLSCSGSVGRCCTAPPGVVFCLVRSVAVLKPVLGMGAYLSLAIRSLPLQIQISRKKTQTAQANIFQGKIKTLAFPVPPLAEQEQIAAEADERLSLVNAVGIQIKTNTKRSSRLRQSILKRAFEGKLVPQDPTDEPASKLLDRIKAQRETNGKTTATKQSARKRK